MVALRSNIIITLFTELIAGRRFVFESRLGKEEYRALLISRTNSSKWNKDDLTDKPFVGRIKGDNFSIRRLQFIKKAFTPHYKGRITEKEGKAVLVGRISIHPIILLILSFWFILFFSIAGVFIYFSGMDETSDWIMLFPLFFIFLLLFMVLLMARLEIDKLHEDLDMLLDIPRNIK